MQKEILDYQSRFHFELNIIDIDDFPDLEEKYNEKVPTNKGKKFAIGI